MTVKQIFRLELSDKGWYGIREGSHLVSYCAKCQCQRCHYCIGKEWVNGDWLFSFRCNSCYDLDAGGKT